MEDKCEGVSCLLDEFKEVTEITDIIASVVNICNNQLAVELALERFQFVIDQYQEQPHLLDPYLEKLCGQLLSIVKSPSVPDDVLHLAFQMLYHITKTRGYKVIVRLMPHEVADLEPILALLSKQSQTDLKTWSTRYMLLLWLSIVIMIPFDMHRLDGDVEKCSGDATPTRAPIMLRVIEVGKSYLGVSDKSRDSAAYMLSKFLTRPDVKKLHLAAFVEWALVKMAETDKTFLTGQMLVCGLLSVLAGMYKHGKREDVVDLAPDVLQKLSMLNLLENENTLVRKLTVKLVQRLGLSFLKARLAAWRYQRGNRSLSDNLTSLKQVINIETNEKPAVLADVNNDEDYDIPDSIEEIIEKLLSSLKDKNTVVRWSAAKGIGRITGRLHKELADDVVGSIIETFSPTENENAWHGGCLAMAELGRRGLILPARLGDVVPIITKALVYDEKWGNFSFGANVRDAACYLCWSFARAYSAEEIAPYVERIASMLAIVSVFDREVNVRRAAAAAFQENVGRQGQFPHGIDILSTCDYFAVGNRNNCYLELSVYVAQFSEYTLPLIEHIISFKIGHWDLSVRELAAKCLHRLTAKAPDYMARTALPQLLNECLRPDVNTHHGALLSVAYVLHALYLVQVESGTNLSLFEVLEVESQEALFQLTSKLQDACYFKGVGGEMMRKAVCCLIEKCSVCKLPFHEQPVIELWQALIDECLMHINPEIQDAAVEAIPSFFSEYYTTIDGAVNVEARDKILSKYLKGLESGVETTRCGHALALGALPVVFLTGSLSNALSKLIVAASIGPNPASLVLSRRDSLKAITSICKRMEVNEDGTVDRCLCRSNVTTLFDAFFVAMKDYTLDSRGDVGAWVREAAMTSMCELLLVLVRASPQMISEDIVRNVFCNLMQQSCEKIDRTRSHAGTLFAKLLYHSPIVPHIPHHAEVIAAFPEESIADINWASPADVFAKFEHLMSLPTYSYSIMLGLSISAGGLTESLVKQGIISLRQFFSSSDAVQVKMGADVLLSIFGDFQKVDRVTLPLIKTIDQLLSANSFMQLPEVDSIVFATSLITLVKAEISRCKDVQKLLASTDIFCDLLQFGGSVRKSALTHLMLLLCHTYPIVRKNAASKLYEATITYDNVVPEAMIDDVTALLLETLWDQPLDVVRPVRNELCDILEIKRPVPVQGLCSSPPRLLANVLLNCTGRQDKMFRREITHLNISVKKL